MYIEIAIGEPSYRGSLVPREHLASLLKEHTDTPIYRSVYMYDEETKQEIDQRGSLKGFLGKRFIDKIIVDIDKEERTDEETYNLLRSTCMELNDLGIPEEGYQVYFSGSGYHIAITNAVFGFESGEDLPYIVKRTMEQLLPHIDTSIYQRNGIYRVPHTLNQKTGLYKIPLHMTEVWHGKVDEILKRAKERRLDFDYHKLQGDLELHDTILTDVPDREALRTVREPTKVVTCVQRMFNRGPVEGTRHTTLLRMMSHFRRSGIPAESARASAHHWNGGSMDDAHVDKIVTDVYNRGYQYSCFDEVMRQHCSPRCIYFKRKDYVVDVKSAEDMQEEMHERITTDYSGRGLDLARHFGLQRDAFVYPGESVVVMGPTGVNKTTFAQNIMLGYDAENNRIVREWQIPTLFLSLELSAWFMHRRNLQIIANATKEQVHDNYQSIFDSHKHLLDHVVVQTVPPTLEQIRDKVREIQPALVIVDYIELIEAPRGIRGEYEKLNAIAHGLRSMAVNEDIIVMPVSQVSREQSRNDTLDVSSAKGSGAIENSASKVIGIHGVQNQRIRKVEMYKNTDGDMIQTTLQWTPSFRLQKTAYNLLR